ncbi:MULTISPECIES: N-acetylmuramoyl-L-alanine amidase family protein [Bacillus]|uniref:peptidoglycan recognition protein family protein n=1 Tax=Bacillus TaxID=1386 RepID=UPI001E5B8CF0|nr:MULTISPECIES: N-acetylmuramoyl-L-alanine amidase family protein [Bacillus]MCC8351524.1 N-acetylmuramoyl-L-alanine amidase family protein [Bacillus sp. AF23]MEC1404139.1 N-acetylmuramoyl-L-alanine amidase family protein [Bacillus subtilis]
MTIQARQMLVPSSKYSIKCPYAMTAEYITFHNTANDASANNEISYMRNNNATVSYHFAVDDEEVVQGLPTNRNAWHCGDGEHGTGNRKSIGVEVCYSKSGGERYRKAEALAIKFIAQLLKELGWGVERVKKHQEWSGKYCPHRVLDEGRWNEVKAAIAAELKSLGGKSTTPTKTSTKPTTSSPSSSSAASGSLKSKVDGLRFYSKPSWEDKDVVGTVNKGIGFPTVVEKVKVGSAYQYKVKNSKGATYYITASDKYVDVTGSVKASSPAPKTTSTSSSSSSIKSVGKIKIIGVSSAAIVMDKPDRNSSKNIGTVKLGSTISISGSVKGKNNSKGYWEVIYNGKRGYISGQFGSKI